MIIRARDLKVTEARYGFIADNVKEEHSVLFLTMDQTSDQLAAGVILRPIGEARRVWGDSPLLPENL
jgi:hypothetical protein